jgi:hypothetical protein
MLTVLAGGLNAKAATVTQPKAMIGTCMAIAYATRSLDRTTTMFYITYPTGLAEIYDAAPKDWWQKQQGKQRASVVLGTRILNALRLARFASWGVGPLGFFVLVA